MNYAEYVSKFDFPELSGERKDIVCNVLGDDASPSEADHDDFNDWFSKDKIQSKTRVKDMQFTETLKCETERGTVYFGQFKGENRKIESKLETRREGYKLSQAYALPTVPHTFGEDWYASVGFDGEYDSQNLFRSLDRLDTFLTGIAKNILLFNWDIADDILMCDDGNYAHIDVTPRYYYPLESLSRLLLESKVLILKGTEYPPQVLNLAIRRAYDLGIYVCHHMDEFINTSMMREKQYNTYRSDLPKTIAELVVTETISEQPITYPSGHWSGTFDGYDGYFVSPDNPWNPVEQSLRDSE